MSRLTDRLGLPTERGPRVMILSAHPDDAEIGAGATIATLARERPDAEVTWLVLACGDDERASEARASAERLLKGVARIDITLSDLRDGHLPYLGPAAKDAIAGHAGAAPDLILSPRRDDAHQDHRHVAELVPQVFRTGTILEYEIPKWDGDLGTANIYVPITSAEADAKVEHLLTVFASQRDRSWFTPATFTALLRLRGIECRAPDGLAEAFVCRKLVI